MFRGKIIICLSSSANHLFDIQSWENFNSLKYLTVSNCYANKLPYMVLLQEQLMQWIDIKVLPFLSKVKHISYICWSPT